MVKLNKSKRIKPKEDYRITKTGKVTKQNKTISTAYEKKYAHRIVENYTLDKKGRLHNNKGRFQSAKTKEKYDKLVELAKSKTDKRKESDKVTTTRRTDKGHFMKSNYALTYECTCYIEESSTTNDEDKTGQIKTHYYTISSKNLLTYDAAISRHNRHYPNHSLINIDHISTKILSFD